MKDIRIYVQLIQQNWQNFLKQKFKLFQCKNIKNKESILLLEFLIFISYNNIIKEK